MGQNRGSSDKDLVSFNAGELSPLLDSRSDLEKASSGCRILENMIVETYGSVRRRPGTQYIAATRTGVPPPGPDDPPVDTGEITITGSIASLAVQSDGKILIGAHRTTSGGGDVPVLQQGNNLVGPITDLPNYVYRINTDGTLDETFNCTAFATGAGWLFVQPSGKIIVVGYFSPGTNAQNVMRLNSNGSQDVTFVPPVGSALSYIAGAAMLSDGRLFLSAIGPGGASWAGGFGSFYGTPVLLQLNGALDSGFVIDPTYNVFGPMAASGLKVAVGWLNDTPEGLSRLTAAGAIDISYAGVPGYAIGGIYLHSDGRMIICTHYSGADGAIHLFAADGTEVDFPTMSHPFGGSTPLPIEPGVQGIFYDGTNYILMINGSDSLLKCTTAGVLIPGFYTTFNAHPRVVVVNADGSMWVAGDFYEVNGFNCNSFTLLHSSGYKIL